VPTEQLKKSYQACQRLLDKQVRVLQDGATQLDKHQRNEGNDAQFIAEKYDTLIAYLRGFQAKRRYFDRLGARLAHLEEFEAVPSQNSPQFERWNRCRLDRVMLDFLLRHGHHLTARQLAAENNLSMADFELFEHDAKIEAELREGKCTKALLWCNENRTALKKLKSTFEFNLKLQEFVELSRRFKYGEAIAYAKRNLQPYSNVYGRELQQVLTLLAFPPTTGCEPYKRRYSPDRWGDLVDEFRRDSFALHSLPAQPALALVLQAGLSALKTPQCRHLWGAGGPLPFSHHTNSTIVCRITGKLMDESNPPLVLPDGSVYSTKAVHEQVNACGYFHDPQSGLNFTLDQFKKVYIL
ncbi:GID complex subunit containing RING finger motif, partial [Massospora cicadina]